MVVEPIRRLSTPYFKERVDIPTSNGDVDTLMLEWPVKPVSWDNLFPVVESFYDRVITENSPKGGLPNYGVVFDADVHPVVPMTDQEMAAPLNDVLFLAHARSNYDEGVPFRIRSPYGLLTFEQTVRHSGSVIEKIGFMTDLPLEEAISELGMATARRPMPAGFFSGQVRPLFADIVQRPGITSYLRRLVGR